MRSSESSQVWISELTHLVVQMCYSTTFTERAALYKLSHAAVWVHLSLMIWGLIAVDKSPCNRAVYSTSIQMCHDRKRRLVKQRAGDHPPQLQTTPRRYDASSVVSGCGQKQYFVQCIWWQQSCCNGRWGRPLLTSSNYFYFYTDCRENAEK